MRQSTTIIAVAAVMVVFCADFPPQLARGQPPVPATTQAAEPAPTVKFVGSQATGRNVVFIVDATGAMMSQFDNLRVELRKSIEPLQPSQAFNVVFNQANVAPPISTSLLPATPNNKQRIYDYIDKCQPRGPTDPDPAIKTALAMHPDLIFFLCVPNCIPDPARTTRLFKTLDPAHKCRINTISFMDETHTNEDMLQQIAKDSGGEFKHASEEDLRK